MNVTLVHVRVKSEHVEDFLQATRDNHEASIREPGNQRFDVLQSSEDPTRFVLYEAYADGSSEAAHKMTAHYHAWREAVADWMAAPRVGVVYSGLLPGAGR